MLPGLQWEGHGHPKNPPNYTLAVPLSNQSNKQVPANSQRKLTKCQMQVVIDKHSMQRKGGEGGGMSNIHFVETGIGSSQEGHLSDSTTLCGRVPKFQAAGTGSAFMKSH